MKKELKTLKNYRKNYNRYYDIKQASYDYLNRGERRKSAETFNSRRYERKKQEQNIHINLFAVKAAISFICVVSIFAAVNFNIGLTSNIRENIKSALSENISYEKVENIVAKTFNKNDEKSEFSNDYYNFRIDENIIEQMNSETDTYYENHNK